MRNIQIKCQLVVRSKKTKTRCFFYRVKFRIDNSYLIPIIVLFKKDVFLVNAVQVYFGRKLEISIEENRN